ncbi:unnamed protein product, partial [Mesorhabditis spiculigera]
MSYQAHIVAAPNEYRLPWPGVKSISCVKFGCEGARDLVGVTGWDGSVFLYNVQDPNDVRQAGFYFHGKPVLCCSFAGSARMVSGGADNVVKVLDIATAKTENLGKHDMPVRCVGYMDVTQLVASGSWDKSVKLWDHRARGSAVSSDVLSDRVYAMDTKGHEIVVGTRDRKIYLYDIRNMQNPVIRESPLRWQTRTVKYFPEESAFVVASIEGRVAVEYISSEPEVLKKKYAFKCHRAKDTDGVELVYPVNALAFHPKYSSLATGGSDKQVNIWDPFNRKRLVQLYKFDASVVSLDFNHDGSQIAIASSYAYEDEEIPATLPPSTVTIRTLNDSDVKIKG